MMQIDEKKQEVLDALCECAFSMLHEIARLAESNHGCLDDASLERADMLTHTVKSIASIEMAGQYDEGQSWGRGTAYADGGQSMRGYSAARRRSPTTGRFMSGADGGGGQSMRGGSYGTGRDGRSYGGEDMRGTIQQIEQLLNEMKTDA